MPRADCDIYDIQSIREILRHCHYDSFVLLDLDNTLIEPKNELGSDQWFSSLIQYATHLIPDQIKAVSLVIAIYYAVQEQIEVRQIEVDTVKIIRLLQDIGLPILAITSRGQAISEATQKQLQSVGVDFTRQWGQTRLELPLLDQEKMIYENGILFCDGKNKGQCFGAWCQALNYYPPHICMVDDKLTHLLAWQEIIKMKPSQRWVGLRYGYLDEKVKSYQEEKGMAQLKNMYPLLPLQAKDAMEKLNISYSPALFYSPPKRSAEQNLDSLLSNTIYSKGSI